MPWHALGAGFGRSVDEGPCRPSGSGRKWGVETCLPGELELGWGAGRSKDGSRGGETEVVQDCPDDLAVGDEGDELALAPAPGGV